MYPETQRILRKASSVADFESKNDDKLAQFVVAQIDSLRTLVEVASVLKSRPEIPLIVEGLKKVRADQCKFCKAGAPLQVDGDNHAYRTPEKGNLLSPCASKELTQIIRLLEKYV